MAHTIIILGTNHIYQAGGKDCANDDSKLLRNLLLNVCRKWNLLGIAEEMNSEGLIRYKSTQSVPYQVAAVLGLSHCYCDPNTSERVQAGIINSGDILFDAQQNGFNEDETAKRLIDEEIKREKYWLNELQKQDVWPILFVCGSNHAIRFKSLLDSTGYITHILAANWSPSTTIEQIMEAL